MSAISFRHVSKLFAERAAVADFNLEVEDGEFVVLVGPSGCGKTTTLRMLAGLEDVSSGGIFIDGRDVTHVHPKDRNIAMVFQSYALYPHKTVAENLAFALKLAKVPRPEIARRVGAVAKTLGLEEVLDRRPKTLSGGQRQRVAVGRAIIREPKVFLFDEPLSNLDAKLRVGMRLELIKLHHALRATMVYVTHDQVEAMTMGDRIVVMRDGHIQQIGTPLQIYDDPGNVFVGGFIGSPAMNFLAGSVGSEGGGLKVDCAGLVIRLPGGHPAGRVKAVTLGIRPEAMKLDPEPGDTVLEGRIGAVEHLGAETIVETEFGDVSMTVRSVRRDALGVGMRVKIGIDPAKVFAFDAKTEERLSS